MLKVHESTISRRIDKLTKHLRKSILKSLGASGLDRRAAEELLEADVRDLAVNVSAHLRPASSSTGLGRDPTQETAGTAFHTKGEKS